MVAAKKPTQKLLTKVPSQKSTAVKSEPKPLGFKPKESNQKQKTNKPKVEGENKTSRDEDPFTETSAKRGPYSLEKATEGKESILNSADMEVASSEVIQVASEVPEASNEVIEVLVNG